MNARTQISMDPQLQRRAHAKAAELGISFAEYVRRLVAEDIGERKAKPAIASLFDLGASDGPTDIARDKHRMIDAAVWEDYRRKAGGQRPKVRKARGR
jgi:hypothetical protein